MPARSSAQRRWAFGVKGAAWAREHHFDNKGELPERSPRKRMIRKFHRRHRGRAHRRRS